MTETIQICNRAGLDRMTLPPRLSKLPARSAQARKGRIPISRTAEQHAQDPLSAEFDWQREFVYFGNHAEPTNRHGRREDLSWSASGG